MTSKWSYLPLTSEEQKSESQLAKKFADCAPVSELLAQRGISTVDEAERFFHPSLRDLHDPFLMPDMDKAVKRLNKAMGKKRALSWSTATMMWTEPLLWRSSINI